MPVDQLLREHALSQKDMLDIFRWHGFYMFIVGTFHGDIHPGNIIFKKGVHTLVDTGALSHVSTRIQQGLFEFMKALSRYDFKLCALKLNEMASVSICGKKYLQFESKLLDLYRDFPHKTVSEVSLTKQMMYTIRLGVLSGMTFEKGMFPIIKSLMYLDGIVLQGAPNMILMEEMRQYIQSFEGINKTNVEGQVYFEKPNHFKIKTTKPSRTELIVNYQEVYRTDYDLNETIKYKLANIESQIPALLLLKSKSKVCNFLNNSEASEFISDLNIISDNGSSKIISYKDQFGIDTQISFVNIKLNDELDKKIFDYNKETTLVILN